VDPLASQYPWNSPYAFSANNTIAYIELEGLERYFAADGRYIGHLGRSNQMRVIDDENLQTFITFYKTHRDALNPPLFKGSVPFHDATDNAQINITQSIYGAVIRKGGRLENVRVNMANDGTGMSVLRGTSKLTIYPKLTKNGEYVLDDYYNFINLLYHEEQHIRGMSDDGWTHFEIAIMQTKHWSYKKMSEAGKGYIKGVMRGYIKNDIEHWMNKRIFNSNSKQEAMDIYNSYQFQYAYKKYREYVQYYNNIFNENMETRNYLNFINKHYEK